MLMRFDPFSEFDRLSRDLFGRQGAWMPADAYRKEDRYFVHIDMPGVDPETIDITVEKNTVSVTSERRWERDEDTQVLISERPQGKFTRRFLLGEGLDADRIEAGYDHGVLTLTIPVAETARPRKIEVGSGHPALTG